MTGYDHARRLPPAMLAEALTAERGRQAEQRLQLTEDLAVATGLDLGKRYVDPKAKPREGNEPYNDLTPFLEHQQALREEAYPWTVKRETPEERAARLDAEQDAAFRRMFGSMQA